MGHTANLNKVSKMKIYYTDDFSGFKGPKSNQSESLLFSMNF